MKKAKKFSPNSSNLWVNVLTFVLGAFALGGVDWGMEPAELSGKIVTTLQGGSLWAVGAIVFSNMVVPVFHIIKSKPQNFWSFLSSNNFWVQFTAFALGLGVMFGIGFDVDASGAIVDAVAMKDWAALLGIIFPAVLNPLIRYLKDVFAGNNTATA